MKDITTPIGVAYYPKLTMPDTKFEADGEYTCKLHVSEKEYNEFKAQIDPWFEKEYQQFVKESGQKSLERVPASKLPLKINKDGDYEIKAKQIARKKTSQGDWTFTINVVDSQGNRMDSSVNIGSGSKIRLSLQPKSYNSPMMGVGYTFKLRGAQVIDLVEYSSGGVSGFDAVEGGFVAEQLDDVLKDDETNDAIPF